MTRKLPTPSPAPGRVTSSALILVALLAASAPMAGAATTISWNNAAGGLWSDPNNWTPANVPDVAGEEAVLPALSGDYQVTLDISPAVDRIQIAADAPTLDLNGQSIAAVPLVENSGTIRNFVGAYQSWKLRNYSTGTILGAYNGTISAVDSLENFGVIVVGPGASSKLYTPSGLLLSGTGKLILDRSTIQDPNGDFGGRLKIRPGVTVTGSGVINKRIENYGTFECDGQYGPGFTVNGLIFNFGGTIRVAGHGIINVNRPLVQNFGTITSGPGGGAFTLRMESGNLGTIDLRNGGRLVVDGGDLNISCLQMYEGEIQRVGTTGAMNIDIGTLQNMTIASGAEVRVTDHIDFMASGQSLVNNGTLKVLGSIHFGILNSPDSIWIRGNGVVKLEGGRLGSGSGGYLVNAPGMTIEGCGTILPPFVNEGTVNFDCAPSITGPGVWLNGNLVRARSGSLTLTGAQTVFRNRGRFVADALTRIEKGATLDNTGGVVVASRGRVQIGNHNSIGTITGGRLEGGGTGDYYVQKIGVLDDVTLAAGATLQTATGAATILSGHRFRNEGTHRISGTGRTETSGFTQYLQTGGTTWLDGGTLASERSVQIQGGVLRGRGTVAGHLTNAGRVSADVGASGLRIEGGYIQTPAGTLEASIAGPLASQVGRLDVRGHAELAGSVAPALAGGYAPTSGLSFEVMSFGSVSGQFGPAQAATGETSALSFVPMIGPGSVSLITGGTTGVGDGPGPVSRLGFFGRNTPQGANFVLELPYAAELKGRVFDAAGREVARLVDGPSPAGVHTFAINRAGSSVRGLASGVYFARIGISGDGGSEMRTARVVVLR